MLKLHYLTPAPSFPTTNISALSWKANMSQWALYLSPMPASLPPVLVQLYGLETIYVVTHRVSLCLLISADGFMSWMSLSLCRACSHFQVPFIPTTLLGASSYLCIMFECVCDCLSVIENHKCPLISI